MSLEDFIECVNQGDVLGAVLNAQSLHEGDAAHAMLGVADKGNIEVLLALLEMGFDINSENDHFWTCAHFIAHSGHSEMLDILIEAGGQIDGKTNVFHNTPLHFATRQGHVDMVSSLIRAGANVNSQDKDMKTPLHLAVETDNLDIAILLIHANTHLEIRNIEGLTALHIASFKGYTEVVACLLEAGADVNAKNSYGQTPLYCTEPKYEKVLQLLRDAGGHKRM